MLQIMCWVDSEDYWYLHSMNEKDQKLDYYGYEVRAKGRFPFVMDLDSGFVYVPEDTMGLKVVSDGDDLSILSSFNPDLESLTGEIPEAANTTL